MNLLSKKELNSLLNHSKKYCISIYLPTEKAGPQTRQNPIRFKNLVSEAEEKLRGAGVSASEVDELLQTARTLIDDYDFWQHQNSGLACFIYDHEMHSYQLPLHFPELVVISNRSYLKPLLPLIAADHKFYLLALAQNQIRLFEGTHFSIQELALPEDVPTSLAEALRYDDPEKQLQFHSVQSDRQILYHGQGGAKNDNKEELVRYFRKLAQGLESI